MLVFIKLGGSLITDKQAEASYRAEVVQRLGLEIRQALDERPALQVLLGHGRGSFGHFGAARYQTIAGVQTTEEWCGFAEVARAAATLNSHVATSLTAVNLPIWQIQPSASSWSIDGEISTMERRPIEHALRHGIIPLVYGDVSLDAQRGGTITSTEKIFFYLAQHLPVARIFLLGEVDGVYDQHGAIIPEITPANLNKIIPALGGSGGTDVTGGMRTKVSDMLDLARVRPGLQIHIINGAQPDVLREALIDPETHGTCIHAG